MEHPRSVLASDRGRFVAAGALLLAMAAAFLWQDLDLRPEYFLAIVAAASAAAALAGWPRIAPAAGFVGLMVCAVGGGAWFAGSGTPALLPGLVVAVLGAVAAAAVVYPRAKETNRTTAALAWYALAAVMLVASWALYFRFLTLGIAETHVARRMVLTLTWLVGGVALVLAGRRREEPAIANAGQVFVAAAFAKAIFYDTTHLGGELRVITLAAAGALLLGGAQLLRRVRA
jgi:hypothetical protein